MKLTVLAGISGSGKSTLAKQLATEAATAGQSVTICAIDDFFTNLAGEYRWEGRLLGRNHRACQDKAWAACKEGNDLVIIDCTNLKTSGRAPYKSMAAEFGYQYEVLVVGEFSEGFARICAGRNQHGVPLDTILKMAQRGELA